MIRQRMNRRNVRKRKFIQMILAHVEAVKNTNSAVEENKE